MSAEKPLSACDLCLEMGETSACPSCGGAGRRQAKQLTDADVVIIRRQMHEVAMGLAPGELDRLKARERKLVAACRAAEKALTEDGWIETHWPLAEIRAAIEENDNGK